ncbi:Type IV pilus biogenesis and competence protein PilQ precursor [Stieleria neptunia]|uniref:Type IV pilus biogenesis and competence protein PilQ n=1 Tax=Stieleria neptunia TaxID=2527979 RepID=A0A518HR60_9BACT|nr:secretin N-terminal domain-containing protein [Stieleria neptunia]QDV43340.1 Type IV pilus biogenesis and competence protein PilQ precursor [Stieleria neptunia]
MRILSLAIIGTLCLGMMPCAQTADTQVERASKIAAGTNATGKTSGSQRPDLPETPGDPACEPPSALLLRGKSKTILQAGSSEIGVFPADVTTAHQLTNLPPGIDASAIRLVAAADDPPHAPVALAAFESTGPSSSSEASDSPASDPSQWQTRGRSQPPAAHDSAPLTALPLPPADVIPLAELSDQTAGIRPGTRQRRTSAASRIVPIAGKTPIALPVPNRSSDIRSAPPGSRPTATTGDTAKHRHPARRPQRVPDGLRPVASARLMPAPEPVGTMPQPLTPSPARAAYTPMAPPHPSDIGNLQSIQLAQPATAENLSVHNGSIDYVVHHAEPDAESDADQRRDVQIADLIVGSLPHSTRRIAQVVAESDDAEAADAPTELPQPAADRKGFAIPLKPAPGTDRATLEKHADLVTLIANDADLRSVLRMIADHHTLNLVIGPDVNGPVTVSIRGARLDEVLDAILGVAGFHWHRSDNLLYVTGAETATLDPKVQGRRLQVYPLNYVAAADVQSVVTGLLSPVGKAYTSEADQLDQLKTRELLIVEDNEAGHQRVSQYIAQIDIPPRQVLVEAHVLQIDLNDEERHGVNLRALARVSGAKVVLEGTGFAEENPEGPSLAFRINGTDIGHLIEAIHVNTNSRTLASPKVSVVNRQTAKVQIGQRLPYAVATTTQTATIQNVQFLDVGIVLEVTPVITQDGNILMTVLPKVSGGKITESGFPEEDTTQVSTTVLMPDGSGLVIGGLIRETDSMSEAKVPLVGSIPVVKRLFNKRAAETRRNELVVALVTHIMHDPNPVREKECLDLQKALPPHAAKALRYSPEIRYSNH